MDDYIIGEGATVRSGMKEGIRHLRELIDLGERDIPFHNWSIIVAMATMAHSEAGSHTEGPFISPELLIDHIADLLRVL